MERSDGLLEDERAKAAHDLLCELIGQDFDIDLDVLAFGARLGQAGSSRRSAALPVQEPLPGPRLPPDQPR
jgi:hypothetical protein